MLLIQFGERVDLSLAHDCSGTVVERGERPGVGAMQARWRVQLPVLLLLLVPADAGRLATRPSARRPASLLLLRGGGDDAASAGGVLPVPAAERDSDTLPAQAGDDDVAAAAQQVGCWSGLQKLWQMLVSLLSPSYSYAKVGTDILGDSSQMSGFDPDDESWRTQRKKLNEEELQAGSRKRVLKDLRIMKRDGAEIGIEVEDCECLTDWVVKVVGAAGTVYEGEIYRLRVRFHADYPSQPPTVTFMRPAPVHEHIYSDGKVRPPPPSTR